MCKAVRYFVRAFSLSEGREAVNGIPEWSRFRREWGLTENMRSFVWHNAYLGSFM